MRSIILSAILALASLCANAAPLPSSISGAYLTPERVCRVEAFRWTDPRWTQVEIRCMRFGDGHFTSALYTIWTLGQCPQTMTPFAFEPSAADPIREHFAITGYTGSALSVVVGLDPTAVANGNGTPQTWQLVESIASRAPYTCAPAQSLRFRVFGR